MSDGSGSGFEWGLRPSGDADEPEPAAPEHEPTALEPEPAEPEPAEPEPAEPEPAAPWDPGATHLMPQPEPSLFATELFSTEALPPAAALAPATELMGSGPVTPEGPDSALDALFGESQFHEYDTGVLTSDQRPFAAGPSRADAGAAEPVARAGISRSQMILLSVVGGLVAVLALVALFFVGTRLPAVFAHKAAAPLSSPSASPTPTATAPAVGPVAIGVHAWSDLLGGECLDPFTTPWAEKFTVVDCAAPHPAQMVFRGTFDTTADQAFPGVDKLQAQISLLCSAPGVINLAAAGAYNDAQIQGSFAVTDDQWTQGEHDYFCFVNRSSGQPLTGSVAVPRAAPATPAP